MSPRGSMTIGTILVVDDDPLVRMDLVDVLEGHGLRVVEAESADEAIAILDRRPDVNVLVTDIEMPGAMDGLRLAHHVRRRWPPVKILVISGRLNIAPDDLPETAAFLRKPFVDHQVLTEIDKLAA